MPRFFNSSLMMRVASCRLICSREPDSATALSSVPCRFESQRQMWYPSRLRSFGSSVGIEATLDAPSGPPEPIKPSFELYGQFLLAQGRTKDAAAQFEQALQRMPNRRLSNEGLARANRSQSTAGGAR